MSRLELAKKAIEEGVAQYLAKIDQDPSDNKAYIAFEATLENYLSNPSNYSEQEQVDLLNSLQNAIVYSQDGTKKEQLLDTFSWTIFSILVPYLSQHESTSEVALTIFELIAQSSIRETYTMIFERFSLLDWEKADVSASEFAGLIKRFKRNTFLKFCGETIRYVARVWSELENLSGESLDLVIESLIDFAETVTQTVDFESAEHRLTVAPENIPDLEFFLVNYLLITSFEKYIRSVDIPMSTMYYEKFHPKFNIPWRKKQSKDSRLVDGGRIGRLMKASIFSGISDEQLVNYVINVRQKTQLTEEDLNAEETSSTFDTLDYPISSGGVLTYLASVIYYESIAQEGSSIKRNLFSEPPDSMFKKIIPIATRFFMTDGAQEHEIIDKILLVLIYLSERNDENTITLPNLNAKLTKDEVTLEMLFQALSSFASTSPNESLRFYAHQLLSRIIALCTDDARMFLLQELLTTCPFEQMRSAAIGILKENVVQRLNQAYDKDSDTGVWNASQLRDTEKQFLDPLKDKCTALITKYENEPNQMNESNSDQLDEGHLHPPLSSDEASLDNQHSEDLSDASREREGTVERVCQVIEERSKK
ncbi:17046_t:CDS:10 [Acaulospora morrowiae]|uniref:17046_t:CDS:1 n=1 Tax=Acaulospora morrowiae TaxID=94023 RepID=A0A9N9B0W3_9GLOM|nr:17046_t:CDS:10 [Acaulospora morrowiae]